MKCVFLLCSLKQKSSSLRLEVPRSPSIWTSPHRKAPTDDHPRQVSDCVQCTCIVQVSDCVQCTVLVSDCVQCTVLVSNCVRVQNWYTSCESLMNLCQGISTGPVELGQII